MIKVGKQILTHPIRQRHQCHQWQLKRYIFGEDFFRPSKRYYKEANHPFKEESLQLDKEMEMYEKRGVTKLSTAKVTNLLSLCFDKNEDDLSMKVLKSYMTDQNRFVVNKNRVVKEFLWQCYLKENTTLATQVIDFLAKDNFKLSNNLKLIYIATLYKKRNFDALVSFVDHLMQKEDVIITNLEHLSWLAALYQIGTPEAFEKAMKYFLQQYEHSEITIEGRTGKIMVAFAVEQGQFGFALDLLEEQLQLDKELKFYQILLVHTLVKAGELEKAVDTLLDCCTTRDYLTVYEELMVELCNEMKDVDDENLNARFKKLLVELDRCGKLVPNTSLKEELLEPITKPAKYSKFGHKRDK